MFTTLKKFFTSKKVDQVVENSLSPELPKSMPNETDVSTKKQRKPRQPRKKVETNQETPTLGPKELATLRGEPYVNIVSMDVDMNNLGSGNFQLDYNDTFVLSLIRAGYKIKKTDTDDDIVDRWFTNVCRSIALEFYEQEQADPDKRSLGDGRI